MTEPRLPIDWRFSQDPQELIKDLEEMYFKVSSNLNSLDLGWVDIRDFGAVGDGVNDDSDAFTEAAATGQSIFIVRGKTYYTDSFTLATDHQGIFGGGTLKAKAAGTAALVTLSGALSWVRAIKIDGNKANQTDIACNGIYITGDYCKVNYCYIANVYYYGIRGYGANKAKVTQNDLISCGYTTTPSGGGIGFLGGEGNKALINYVYDAAYIGVRMAGDATAGDVKNGNMSFNYVEGLSHETGVKRTIGISAGIGSGNTTEGITMIGNTVYDSDNSDGGNCYDLNGVKSFTFKGNIAIGGLNGINPDFATHLGGHGTIEGNLFINNRGRGILYIGNATTKLPATVKDNICIQDSNATTASSSGPIAIDNVDTALVEGNLVNAATGSTVSFTHGIYCGAGVTNTAFRNNSIRDERAGSSTILKGIQIKANAGTGNEFFGTKLISQASDAIDKASGDVVTYAAAGCGFKDGKAEFYREVATNSATPTAIADIMVSDTYGYEILVTVWANGDERALHKKMDYVYRTGAGNAATVGATQNCITPIESDAGMEVTIGLATTRFTVNVTGVAAKDIDWKAHIEAKGLSE